MKCLLPLVLLPLAGCVAFSPETRSQLYLASLTRSAEQTRREQKVGERTVILATYGANFLPPPIQVELAKVMKQRKAQGRWPDATELSSGEERWQISRQDELLLLTREAGGTNGIQEVFVAPDGFIGLDERYRKFFDHADLFYRAAHPAQGSTAPLLILPRRF